MLAYCEVVQKCLHSPYYQVIYDKVKLSLEVIPKVLVEYVTKIVKCFLTISRKRIKKTTYYIIAEWCMYGACLVITSIMQFASP